jgi:tRNA1Val (adenine37-N6)-methyltransferase
MPPSASTGNYSSFTDCFDMETPRPTEETLDTLFQGRLKFYQSRFGYRVSLDSVLLADFARLHVEDKIADLGTGNGVIALILASRQRARAIVGIEVQPAMAERAGRNVKLNGLQNRVNVVCVDVRAVAQAFKPETFSLVLSNPPYRKPSSGRISAGAEKKVARHEISGTLSDFIAAGAHLLSLKGRMALIHPAVRAIDLVTTMREHNIEAKRIRMVHSFATAEASLVLVEGVKGARGGVKVVAPLIIYDREKRYTAEVQSMLAGECLPGADH